MTTQENQSYRFEEAIKTLVFAVGGADIRPSVQGDILKACDDAEEQYDALKAKYDAIANAEITKKVLGFTNLQRAMLIGLQQESIERMKAEIVALKESKETIQKALDVVIMHVPRLTEEEIVALEAAQ